MATSSLDVQHGVGMLEANSPVAAVRSLNEVGQPLPGVTVEETGPQGSRTLATDLPYGVATVGQSAGEHRWQFIKTDYVPVWRRQMIGTNGIEQIVSPRLTRRNPHGIAGSIR